MPGPDAPAILNRLLARGKLRQLQVVLHLAELGSVQRTASVVGLTQSAVSQALAALEGLLDAPLFIRHARGVLPTPACLELLPTVRQLMLGVAQGAESLAAAQREGRQTLRLLASGSATQSLLLPALSRFVRLHPDIRIELSDAEGDDLLLAVARQETDLVVCRHPAAVPAGWAFTDLIPDCFAVVCAPGDPLLHRCDLRWDDLQSRCWLLSSVSTKARARFEQLCSTWPRPADCFPVVTRIISVSSSLIREHGLLGFVPHSFVRPHLERGELGALDVREDLALEPIGVLRPLLGVRDSAERFAAFLETETRVG
jgi:DNA-binding transcriptional LysR family regulator